ncbi:MAG: NfeD family protein [Gammaproteobacteria bacterium]|nr:NfeD family protein [Gammaproteobacteria bacterium]
MVWWGWMVVGALLLGAELFVIEAEFFLVFMGVAAVVTGLLALAAPEVPNWAQWLVFAGLSLVSMVFFRKRVYGLLRREIADLPNDMEREEFELPVGLPVGAACRVELRGSTWTARNVGLGPIPPRSRVRVVGMDGITLKVEARD